jgi:hypothetical protein
VIIWNRPANILSPHRGNGTVQFAIAILAEAALVSV